MRYLLAFTTLVLILFCTSCSLPTDKTVQEIRKSKDLDSCQRELAVFLIENGIQVEIDNGSVKTDSLLAKRAREYYKTGHISK